MDARAILHAVTELRRKSLVAALLHADVKRKIDDSDGMTEHNPQLDHVILSAVDLSLLNNKTVHVIRNRVPLIIKFDYNTSTGYLYIMLNFNHINKLNDLKQHCDFDADYLVVQYWHEKDNQLYLDGNYNHVTTDLRSCDSDAVYNDIRKTFRGAARLVWCVFLEEGIRVGAFQRTTIIKLSAVGIFDRQAEYDKIKTEFDSKNINTGPDYDKFGYHHDTKKLHPNLVKLDAKLRKIREEADADLEKFYTKLGFKHSDKRDKGDDDDDDDEAGARMSALVGAVMKNVCA